MKSTTILWVFCGLLTAWAAACEPSGPRTDSQTHWYRVCETEAECGELDCLCGVCTRVCGTDTVCDELPGASCVPAADSRAIAWCGGHPPAGEGLCLSACDEGTCPSAEACVADVCRPEPEPTARIDVDPSVTYQTLVGFGATLAYVEAQVVGHPRRDALYGAMFADLGLDVLRLRNRYGYSGDDDLTTAGAIVSAASASLSRTPTVMLTSWSPPAALKANSDLACQGNLATCTLARAADGEFDYLGFAAYWRDALSAYAAAGVTPDYIGIQNNPDFVPTLAVASEACRFLPAEGTATVVVGGVATEVEYPGFAEALAEVAQVLTELETPPRIAAPETSGVGAVAAYAAELDFATVDAVAHHLYDMDPGNVDLERLEALGALARAEGRPLLQTEVLADGEDTAILAHHALVVAGAAAYLEGVLAGPAANLGTLIGLGVDEFTLEDPYHALRHYARHTDPGWLRADATSDADGLLTSAWLSPTADALTLVIVNAGDRGHDVQLELSEIVARESSVMRTVFAGVERSAELGALSPSGLVRVPEHAIVTVSLRW